MERVDVVLTVLNTAAAGARRLTRYLEGIRKAQAMDEVVRFRALKDPEASILDVYRFAREHRKEMVRIANTPVTEQEIADSKWRVPPEFPGSVIVDRVERITEIALNAKLNARRSRVA